MPLANTYAVIPAAGTGSRMGAKTKKQYLQLDGWPVLAHTLKIFEKSPTISGVVLVVGEQEVEWCRQQIVERYGFNKVLVVVPGGNHRQHSVYNGLLALAAQDEDIVMVHDGARPLITEEILSKAAEAALDKAAVVVAVPAKDTIKVIDGQSRVVSTPPRERLWQVQTPQVFNYRLLLRAYQHAKENDFLGTDDASLVEYLGHSVYIVPGNYENIKITTPEDMLLAESILQRRREQCE
ncbi:2-C-methyl-D-erythritol 4-phosphate cytidylyltransferase [Peptococcaceae bacterium 1198_IL3148]